MAKLANAFLLILISTLSAFAQESLVTVSGGLREKGANAPLPFASIVVKTEKDSLFVTGTITDESGRFTISNLKPGNYVLLASLIGYQTKRQALFVGSLSAFLDIGIIQIEESTSSLLEIEVSAKQDEVAATIAKAKGCSIDEARQLLLIKGAVPGSKGGFVTVRPAVKAKPAVKGAN